MTSEDDFSRYHLHCLQAYLADLVSLQGFANTAYLRALCENLDKLHAAVTDVTTQPVQQTKQDWGTLLRNFLAPLVQTTQSLDALRLWNHAVRLGTTYGVTLYRPLPGRLLLPADSRIQLSHNQAEQGRGCLYVDTVLAPYMSVEAMGLIGRATVTVTNNKVPRPLTGS